ncbi:MAG: hypothetical protein AAF533_25670 [Acidobacteriota bacterium]
MTTHDTRIRQQDQRGSSLAGTLLITALAGMLAAGLLVLSMGHREETARRRDSIEAFFAAEAGLESGRLAFERATEVFGIPRVTGRIGEATFEVRPGVGNFGDEAWPMWSYDASNSRRNVRSQVGSSLKPGWMTMREPARNGTTAGTFYVNNIYSAVGSGLIYVTYENPADDTVQIAGFDELDGQLLWTTEPGNIFGNGLRLASPALVEEGNTLYVTLTTGEDPDDPVELRALNVDRTGVSLKWTYSTGQHGTATPPVVYNPDPTVFGDEIVYFGLAETPDWTLLSAGTAYILPRDAGHSSEGIYLHAVVDLDDRGESKWAHPFPDPAVAARTDYPVQEWPDVPAGETRRAYEVPFFPPDDDLIVDYHNSWSGRVWRGDMYIAFDPHSLGPPLILADDGGTPEDSSDDIIDIYLYYSAVVDRDTPGVAYGNFRPAPGTAVLRWQNEIAAVRDTPAQRFPTFKWTANPPPWDDDDSDGVPADRYENQTWHTWFEQQIAVAGWRTDTEEDGSDLPDWDMDGAADERNVIYAPYESLSFPSFSGGNNENLSQSRVMVSAYLDSWDDYNLGRATGLDGESRPVEFYWMDAGGDDGAFTRRPTVWSEADLNASGELNTGDFAGITLSRDADVEGETMAFDKETGTLYMVFNHDLNAGDAESLRIHAVDATSGSIEWMRAIRARLAGDAFNGTPSLSGGFIFVFELEPGSRNARLNIFNANDGSPTASSPIQVDQDADGANLAPTIANDVVYVGTYDAQDLQQRVFALSPNVWLLSTGHSANGEAHRTVALLESDGALSSWREGGFSGGGPTDDGTDP